MRSWDGNALPTAEMNAPSRDRRGARGVAAIGAALAITLLPVLTTTGLSKALFDASWHQALPLINDEVAYWNQIATFAAKSFGGGYITVDERPSRISWSHFGPHGPVFALLYGLPAKLFGWGYTSGPVFGTVAFCVAAIILCPITVLTGIGNSNSTTSPARHSRSMVQ